MSDPGVTVSRPLVGLIALGCLGGALAIAVVDTWENVWCAAFVRVGLLMAAIWMALPTRHREAAWARVSPYTVLTGLLAVFVVARWKAALPLVIGLVIVGLMLRPRQRRPPH